jgi:ActR/RegA family two-component response regulator
VLFADDEIPYRDDRDQLVSEELLRHDPLVDDAHLAHAGAAMGVAAAELESAGFDVTVVRTVSAGLAAIDENRFDVAIIDLGWGGDREVDPARRASAGWRLVHALEAKAKREAGSLTPTIMYSMRYLNDAALAVEAVAGGALPLPKNYTSASHQTLIAAVAYLGGLRQGGSHIAEAVAIRHLRQLEAAEQRLQLHSWITIAGVSAILVAGMATVGYVVVTDAPAGLLQAAAASLTGLFSGVLLVLHRRLFKDVAEAREAALLASRDLAGALRR